MDHGDKHGRRRELGVTRRTNRHRVAPPRDAAPGLVGSPGRPGLAEVCGPELPDPHAPALEVARVYVHGGNGPAAEGHHEELSRAAGLGAGTARVGRVASAPPGRCRLYDSSVGFYFP